MALFQATCLAWAAGLRFRGIRDGGASGERSSVCRRLLLKVPLGTTGKCSGPRIATDVVWLDETLEHDQGVLVKWTIRRRCHGVGSAPWQC